MVTNIPSVEPLASAKTWVKNIFQVLNDFLDYLIFREGTVP
jgi:hypothetical protein